MRIIFIIMAVFSINVQASVIINSTRVVFIQDAKETSFQLLNRSDTTHLVQTWIDDGDIDASPEEINVPFVVLPPIVKIGPQNGQEIKIRKISDMLDLPKDRESIFWINVLDIPPEPKSNNGNDNYLQVAIRSRIKLFYRPAHADARANSVRESLSIDKVNNCIKNENPVYVNAIDLLRNNNSLDKSFMIEPFSCKKVDDINFNEGSSFKLIFLDDYGSKRNIVF